MIANTKCWLGPVDTWMYLKWKVHYSNVQAEKKQKEKQNFKEGKTYSSPSAKSLLLTATLFINDISSEGTFVAFIRCKNNKNQYFSFADNCTKFLIHSVLLFLICTIFIDAVHANLNYHTIVNSHWKMFVFVCDFCWWILIHIMAL